MKISILVPIKERSSHYNVLYATVHKYILDVERDVEFIELFDEFEGESFAHKINRGMLKTEGDIVILHTDMYVLEDWWKGLFIYVEFGSGGIYGSKMVFANNPKIIQHFGGHITYDGDAIHPERGLVDMGQFDVAREVPFVTFGGCCIKRIVIDKVGYLDEAIYPWGYEDVDYCLRARKEGFKVVCTPATLWHSESKDAKTLESFDEIIKRNREYVMRKHNIKVEGGVPQWK